MNNYAVIKVGVLLLMRTGQFISYFGTFFNFDKI